MTLNDLSDDRLPLSKRVTLALEFAIGALNDAPSFGTHIKSPDTGQPLSSYRVLARLDPVLREAKAAAAQTTPESGAHQMNSQRTTPSNEERAGTAEKMMIFYDILKGQPGEMAEAPACVISDLITDLLHYANREEIDFPDALAAAYTHFAAEAADPSGPPLYSTR